MGNQHKTVTVKGWKIIAARRVRDWLDADNERVGYTLTGWRRAARNWRRWLRQTGLDTDPIVDRPTERSALRTLEAESYAGETLYALPLSPSETDLYNLEQEFLRTYRTGKFILRWGILYVSDKYAWIAAQRPGLHAIHVRASLDDIHYALKAYYYDVAVRNIKNAIIMPEPEEV